MKSTAFPENLFCGLSGTLQSLAREMSSSDFWNGSTFTPEALPQERGRRHSFTGAPSRSANSPPLYSFNGAKVEADIAPLRLSQAMEAVHEYFEADPHERVHVTSDLLRECYTTGEYCLNPQLHARQGGCMALPSCSAEVLATLGLFRLVLVAFKLSRIDVFYIDTVNSAQALSVGDLVIVEADRGRDLGRVARLDLSVDEARLLKLLHFQDQQAAFSASMLRGNGSSASGETISASAPAVTSFPKCVLGLAQPHEIMQILAKNQDEDRACRLCLAKISMAIGILGLPKSPNIGPHIPSSFTTGSPSSAQKQQDLLQMQLVDVEYQFDRKKLIFYYSTTKRIDFRELVRELFRIYKTRIWMCAVTGLPYRTKSTWLAPLPILQPLLRQGEDGKIRGQQATNLQPGSNPRTYIQPWNGQSNVNHQGQAHYSPYNRYAYGAGLLPPSFGQMTGPEKLSPTLAAAHAPYEPVSPLILYSHGQVQYPRRPHLLGPGFTLPGRYNGQSLMECDAVGTKLGQPGVPRGEASVTMGEWMQPHTSQQGLYGQQLFGLDRNMGIQSHSISMAEHATDDGIESNKERFSAPRDSHKLGGRSEGGSIEDLGSFESPNGFVLQSLVDLINH